MKGFKSFKPRHLAVFLIAAAGQLLPQVVEAKSIEDIIKSTIDDVIGKMQDALARLGDNIEEIQEYFDHYQWKGVVEDAVTSDVVTLKGLHLNGHPRATIVRPGEVIEGVVDSELDKHQRSATSFYRVVLGFKDVGAQTTVCNCLGIWGGEDQGRFKLYAPLKPGLYQIRFRLVESFTESNALAAWIDKDNQQPDASTTIGLVYVTK